MENIRVLRMTNTFKMLDGISNKQQRKQYFANKNNRSSSEHVPCGLFCSFFINIHSNTSRLHQKSNCKLHQFLCYLKNI